MCGLFVGFLGCSEKSEVAKQLLHPKASGMQIPDSHQEQKFLRDAVLISDIIN